jgi:uncharacterized protein (TIGR02145 family)
MKISSINLLFSKCLFIAVLSVIFIKCKKEELPALSTLSVTEITGYSAKSGGNISDDGGEPVTERGVVWCTKENPTKDMKNGITLDGDGTGNFISNLIGLTPSTTYYVCAYATNNIGTAYGNQVKLTTKAGKVVETDSITDPRDGKVYKTFKIGNQWWMAENLAWLPDVSPSSVGSCASSYYYVYDYQGNSINEAKATNNYQIYGVLYNWPAAKNACPLGWHLPTDDEWKTMEINLGMSQVCSDSILWRGTNEGGKIKETGTTHWNSIIAGTTNESGFTALPGGFRTGDGYFQGISYLADWWSSTKGDGSEAMSRGLFYDRNSILRNYGSNVYGFSIRCLRDD